MPSPRRICLISPSHVSANPRLVKEADALQSAGYAVHVVAGWYFPPLDALDAEIYRAAAWDRTLVHYMTGPRVILNKVRYRLARTAIGNTVHPTLSLAIRASHPAALLLARAAARIPADLYIGHLPPGLAAAAHAASRNKGRYGFDAEDFHPAETEAAVKEPPLSRSIQTIEAQLLPGCTHLTAASPLIAEAYRDAYSLRLPSTVLNTFPLAQAPAQRPPSARTGGPARLYWFSQTIGPGRGIDALIAVLAAMKTPMELHLRGLPAPGYVEMLRLYARKTGYSGTLTIHPLAPAAQMPALAADYDLGLSLEEATPANRDLCLTNKIFTYLLAGLPVALTPTRAQKSLAAELGQAALVLDLTQPAATARTLDEFFAIPGRREAAAAEARRLALARYNWEEEQKVLLQSVEAALAGAKPS